MMMILMDGALDNFNLYKISLIFLIIDEYAILITFRKFVNIFIL